MLRSKIEHAKADDLKLQNDCAGVAGQVEVAQQEFAALEAERDQLRRTVMAVHEERARLQMAITEAKTVHQALCGQLGAVDKERVQLQSKVKATMTGVHKMEMKRSKLVSIKRTLQKQLDNVEGKTQRLKELMLGEEQSHEELDDQLSALQDSKAALQENLRQMSTSAANKRTVLLHEQRFQLTECASKVVGIQNPVLSTTLEQRKARMLVAGSLDAVGTRLDSEGFDDETVGMKDVDLDKTRRFAQER